MVLGDVEETVTTVEVDEDTYEELVRVSDSVVRKRVLCHKLGEQLYNSRSSD